MAIKLMYITNCPEVALIAEASGVDRIFIDLEYIGKDLRQDGMDTVKSSHKIGDIKKISEKVKKAEVLVRVNPIHDKTEAYTSSEEEIDAAIENGAQVLMLPFFKSVKEVSEFIRLVNKRARTMLLFETPESVECVDEILAIDGIDEVFVGLNDLSLAYGKKFMFELLADGTVEYLVEKFKAKELPYGFGGLASLEGGLLPGKMVLKEHRRLGSSCVILSRSFCNTSKITDLNEIAEVFKGVSDIRSYEKSLDKSDDFEENKKLVKEAVLKIAGE